FRLPRLDARAVYVHAVLLVDRRTQGSRESDLADERQLGRFHRHDAVAVRWKRCGARLQWPDRGGVPRRHQEGPGEGDRLPAWALRPAPPRQARTGPVRSAVTVPARGHTTALHGPHEPALHREITA